MDLTDEFLLKDVIDAHVHCGPDSISRDIDAVDLARLAVQFGMRGFVIKSHYEPTASLAYLARKAVSGVEVFGGINLNLAVGGINSYAVERMAMVQGNWGRIVWMPSSDSEMHVRFHKENRPFVPVSKDGRLLPEVAQVLKVIAKHKLVLATSHSGGEENILLVKEAFNAGVRRVVVTHAMMAPCHMTIHQMKQAADLGAYIEFAYNGLIGPHKEHSLGDYAQAIQAVGPAHCILSSDLGQVVNPVHPVGLLQFFRGLMDHGIARDDVARMSIVNPADLLGLTQRHQVPPASSTRNASVT